MNDQTLPSPIATLPVLGYRQAEPREPGWRGSLLFLLLILPALVTPFIAFAFGVSPLDVWEETVKENRLFPNESAWMLFCFATPFFASAPLVFWKVTLMTPSRKSRGLCIAMWSVAGLCSLPVVGAAIRALLNMVNEGLDAELWPFPVGMGLLALYWVLAGVLSSRKQSEQAITMAFYAGYLGNAVYCLGGFHGSTEWGYFITVYIAVVMMADTVRMLFIARRRKGLVM